MEMLGNPVIDKNSPLIIEIVGPAGAGKTTLLQELIRCNDKILVGPELELRKTEHLPVFVSQAPFLLPVILRGDKSCRWCTWDEIKYMIYLQGWPRVLRQQTGSNCTTIVLDHGPIFKLATLNEFGPENLKSPEHKLWWQSMINQWASELDLVIWLDAPDLILQERINKRSQKHAIKGMADHEAHEFLARYRKSYEQILKRITSDGGPALLKYDTSLLSIEEIAVNILEAYNLTA